MRGGRGMRIRQAGKHAVLPMLAISVAVLVVMIIHVYDARNNGTIELIDLYGDRSALADTAFSGYIRDSYHEMKFEWAGGAVTKETVVYDEPRQQPSRFSRGTPLLNGGRSYEIYPSFYAGVGFEIQAWRNRSGFRTDVEGMALVETALQYNGSSNGYTFSNYQEKGLAFIGDRVFFVPPTTREYTGKSGIYEVVRFGERNRMQTPEEAETRMVVELNMDGNRSDEWTGLEILGLEAIGDKLALVALVDGEIVVRGYDSDSGKLLGEVKLGEHVYMLTDSSGPPRSGGYYEDYEAFVDEDIEVLNLKFHKTESTAQQSEHLVVSISLQNGVETVNKQELRYEGRDRSQFAESGESNLISYRNGKLYAITVSGVEPEMYTLFESLYDTRVLIEVYEAGERLYSGELRTDITEDVVEDRYFASTHFQQERSQYREIGGFRIRSEK